jgi:hypothetical protein
MKNPMNAALKPPGRLDPKEIATEIPPRSWNTVFIEAGYRRFCSRSNLPKAIFKNGWIRTGRRISKNCSVSIDDAHI